MIDYDILVWFTSNAYPFSSLHRYGTELSLLWDEDNEGKTLDQVGSWYPNCWPYTLDKEESDGMDDIATNKIPIAEQKRQVRLKEMRPFMQKIAKESKMYERANR